MLRRKLTFVAHVRRKIGLRDSQCRSTRWHVELGTRSSLRSTTLPLPTSELNHGYASLSALHGLHRRGHRRARAQRRLLLSNTGSSRLRPRFSALSSATLSPNGALVPRPQAYRPTYEQMERPRLQIRVGTSTSRLLSPSSARSFLTRRWLSPTLLK